MNGDVAAALPATRTERLATLGSALVAAAVLATAALLTPNPAGYGTHEALGLPP
ncbi:MAG: hypothetical protein L0216_13765 [Planctomycetales bacterium]|nr:hypothetical protein [Planctomycetales bacterium]